MTSCLLWDLQSLIKGLNFERHGLKLIYKENKKFSIIFYAFPSIQRGPYFCRLGHKSWSPVPSAYQTLIECCKSKWMNLHMCLGRAFWVVDQLTFIISLLKLIQLSIWGSIFCLFVCFTEPTKVTFCVFASYSWLFAQPHPPHLMIKLNRLPSPSPNTFWTVLKSVHSSPFSFRCFWLLCWHLWSPLPQPPFFQLCPHPSLRIH